ncbi:DUF5937 family protein [Bacillus sp. DX1.1]|uniref:DUF5937 family protein n=1 Tax=unclassified Bacillus (in: firmicutes) TaxID=185979 RepID=UPI002570E6CF|nr:MULTISPECIES: DUF5937 family protein [unclassified Bacillus (in: firmicutes)]MDM5154251.1 DUF5937 family protein [Bacillus sp. DX1.1]WJE83170.1 DUF5937 family protein [Bacillus sp. DX3.1]
MLHITSWFERHVKVVYSPFREMLLSLHVLSNPAHHVKRLEWAENLSFQPRRPPPLNEVKVGDESVFSFFKENHLFCRTYVPSCCIIILSNKMR